MSSNNNDRPTIEQYSDGDGDYDFHLPPPLPPQKVVQFLINETYSATDSESEAILEKVKQELKRDELNEKNKRNSYPPHSILRNSDTNYNTAAATTNTTTSTNTTPDNINEINSSSEIYNGNHRQFEEGDDEGDIDDNQQTPISNYKRNSYLLSSPLPLSPLKVSPLMVSSSPSTTTTTTTTTGIKRDKVTLDEKLSTLDNEDIAEVVDASLNIEERDKSNILLEKKKSMDNIKDLNPFHKSLSEKRDLFVGKIIQKVLNTLKKASNDDLSTSQKDHIIEEIFKDISAEVDDPVFEYLTTFDEKDIEKVNKQQQQQTNGGSGSAANSNYHPYPCLDQFSKRPRASTPQLQSTNSRNSLSRSSSTSSISSNSSGGGSGIGSNLESSSPLLSPNMSSQPQTKEIYYYQLISQYFINNPDKVELFRPLLYSLWTNNQWFYLIYATMFYSWLLEYRLSLISQLNVLIKSSNRLFWYDCDHYSRKYFQVYYTIKQKLLDRSLWNGLCDASNKSTNNSSSSTTTLDPDTIRSNLLRNRRIWIDFYHIICVFYFYYERTNDGINEFRSSINKQYQDFILDSAQRKQHQAVSSGSSGIDKSVLSTDDLFVRGIIKHVALIKREETLIRYIDKCLVFGQNWNLNPTTKVKLQSCLYSLTKPGSPAYVPRSVRTKSRSVLDQLFPDGKFSRHTVNLFFRLLHPYYSIGSIYHWFKGGYNIIKSYIPFIGGGGNNNNQLNNK